MGGHCQHLRKYPLPSVGELRAVLTYDPETGQVSGRPCGVAVGYVKLRWRRAVWLGRARVAWAIVYGYWPDTIEHVNGLRHDDRLCNLRDVSMGENNRLRAIRLGCEVIE